MTRQRGRTQAKPTKSDMLDYYRTLKRKADEGDKNTTGNLIDSQPMTGKKEGQSNA